MVTITTYSDDSTTYNKLGKTGESSDYLSPEPKIAQQAVPSERGSFYYAAFRVLGLNPIVDRLRAGVLGVPNAFTYASANPLRNGDPDGLLDYHVPCPNARVPNGPTIHLPGETKCKDCLNLQRGAEQFCAIGSGCMCNKMKALYEDACKSCNPGEQPDVPPDLPVSGLDCAQPIGLG